MQLVLGVHDLSYAAQFRTPKGKARRGISKAQLAYGSGKTTGDIAKILESKYHIMQTFFDMERNNILAALEESMVGSIVNMASGQPGPVNTFNQAMSDIGAKFKDALSSRALEGYIKGTPTAAATHGVSHRFAKPYQRRGSRPSFIDTGLYQSSFVAWTEP